MGTNEEFNNDLFCGLVFEDVIALQAFFAKSMEPEVAKILGENEDRFIDLSDIVGRWHFWTVIG